MSRNRSLLFCTTMAAIFALIATSAQAQYFKGKTITCLIGYSAGGSTDIQSRVLGKYLGKHLEGKPNIVIKSMPGAGGIKAQNYLKELAPRDGLTIWYGPLATQSELLGAPGMRFKYSELTVIGSMLASPHLTYGRKDIIPGGLKRPADIVKAKNVKIAGLRPTAWYDIYTRQALDLLGVSYTYVPGYRGGARIAAAVRSGEAQIAGITFQGYASRVESSMGGPDGVVRTLWWSPFKDDQGNVIMGEGVVDVPPIFEDVYREVHGKDPSGPIWEQMNYMNDLRGAATNAFLGPPDMNPMALAELRAAYDKMIVDPEQIAETKKVLGSAFIPQSRAKAENAFRDLADVDPAFVQAMRDYATNFRK